MKSIRANYYYEERPSDYLISCLQDGLIGVMDVVAEMIACLSEDEIREVNEALGLYDI